jgi:hypothetical protein
MFFIKNIFNLSIESIQGKKNEDATGESIGVAVGATFAAVVVVVALVLAFIFLRRR